MARVVELIYTEDRRGSGKNQEDPIRLVAQLWSKNGQLVAECDAYGSQFFNPKRLVDAPAC